MLVPVPPFAIVALSTDSNGVIAIEGVQGGGGSFEILVQFVIQDGSQPFGFGLSNAVQLEFLP